jgi:hypothetical protein
MMLWFGPFDGSALGLVLLGLAEGVVLAILVSVYLPVAPGIVVCGAAALPLRSQISS